MKATLTRKYIIMRAPKIIDPQIAFNGRHMQKITKATASQPTPESPSWFQTLPAVVVM